jgi:hypothetical protein
MEAGVLEKKCDNRRIADRALHLPCRSPVLVTFHKQ